MAWAVFLGLIIGALIIADAIDRTRPKEERQRERAAAVRRTAIVFGIFVAIVLAVAWSGYQ